MSSQPRTPRLSRGDVLARRLARHGLSAPVADASAGGVAATVHGVHAQVMSAAEASVALRLPGSTRADVREALWGQRELTKTFGPRGTVHLLATRDLPMWTGALAALPRGRSPFKPDVRLDEHRTDVVVEAVADAVRERDLTLEELDAAVVDRVGGWAGELVMPAFGTLWPRWRQALGYAGHRGAVVFGPDRDRRATYADPRRSTPGFLPLHAAEALPRFVRGYLHAYGPATPSSLARWLNTSVDWATQVLLGADVERLLLEGSEAFVNRGDTAPSEPTRRCLRLLPYFDALAVGFHPREWMFPGRAAERALTRGQAGNVPVVVLDGVVIGVWHQRRSGRRLHLTVDTWADLTRPLLQALDEQVNRLGEILEGTPTLTLGPVRAGPHA